MFGKRESGSSIFGVFWLVILLELLISGDRFVLGRHLYHHSTQRHLQDLIPSDFDRLEMELMELNDLGEARDYNLEEVAEVDVPNSKLPEFPTLVLQPQPEEFLFPEEVFYVQNTDDETNDKLINFEGIPEVIENTLDSEETEDFTMAAVPAPPVTPFSIDGRNIITAPLKDCRKGERRDSKGECRLVLE